MRCRPLDFQGFTVLCSNTQSSIRSPLGPTWTAVEQIASSTCCNFSDFPSYQACSITSGLLVIRPENRDGGPSEIA